MMPLLRVVIPYELYLAFSLVAETLLYMCAELLMVHYLKFNELHNFNHSKLLRSNFHVLPIKIIHLRHQTSLLHVLAKPRLIREPYLRCDPLPKLLWLYIAVLWECMQ